MPQNTQPYVLRTSAGHWIIRNDRLCRSSRAVDPLFVPSEHWELIDHVEINGSQVRVHLRSGEWVSAELSVPAPAASAGAGTTIA
jgi:hypothetical protein